MKDPKKNRIIRFLALCTLTILLPLFQIRVQAAALTDTDCHVVLEKKEGLVIPEPAVITKAGEDLTFRFTLLPEYEITGVSYRNYRLEREDNNGKWILTVFHVRYSQTITVETRKTPYRILYDANGGTFLSEAIKRYGSADREDVLEVPVLGGHLRSNTLQVTFEDALEDTPQDAIEDTPQDALEDTPQDARQGTLRDSETLERPGYSLGSWNTKPDGTGTRVGLGSRIRVEEGTPLTLYAQWKAWTDPACFETADDPLGLAITGFHADAVLDQPPKELVIPGEIGGKPVVRITEDAFAGLRTDAVFLPLSLRKVDLRAFARSTLRTVTLYDTVQEISDYSFEGCENLQTLYINAARAPVYSGTYYDTFPDKYDYLLSIREKPKIVLFSGSSTRFGYDSEMFREAFPGREAANMGVFAYTNALPQLDLILPLMREGDILLHSPEFDAAKRQFCTTDKMDDKFFCMTEANYDLVSLLDLRKYSGTFSAFSTFLKGRIGMEERGYDWNASEFDEEGEPVMSPSYNRYGDYIVYRKNADTDEPVYGLPVDYTPQAFPEELYIRPLNLVMKEFQEKGITVFLTYAPRNQKALSAESTKQARDALDAWFREKLSFPVISRLEDSLYPGHLLFGTDNHLSTEGVRIRTLAVIRDLREALQQENGN